MYAEDRRLIIETMQKSGKLQPDACSYAAFLNFLLENRREEVAVDVFNTHIKKWNNLISSFMAALVLHAMAETGIAADVVVAWKKYNHKMSQKHVELLKKTASLPRNINKDTWRVLLCEMKEKAMHNDQDERRISS